MKLTNVYIFTKKVLILGLGWANIFGEENAFRKSKEVDDENGATNA
ncbi:hypothetical protein [Lactiplantibacillus modestisalitolerans]